MSSGKHLLNEVYTGFKSLGSPTKPIEVELTSEDGSRSTMRIGSSYIVASFAARFSHLASILWSRTFISNNSDCVKSDGARTVCQCLSSSVDMILVRVTCESSLGLEALKYGSHSSFAEAHFGSYG